MGHGHGHGHLTAGAAHRGRLLAVLAMTVVVLVVQVVGAVLTGSLALLADAGHVLTDGAGVLIALVAVAIAARPATPGRTFGLQRVEILAAVVNGALLLVVAGVVLVEAVRRWADPPEVDGGLMLAFAVFGLAMNVVALLLLRRGAAESLNVRGAYLEVMGDAVGSVAVILAALAVTLTGWARADVVASLAVGVFILPRVWVLLREAVDVLLEAAPRGVDLAEVRRHILGTPGVLDAHDLHAWTITSGVPVLSVHVVVDDEAFADAGRILDALQHCVADHFDVEHSTFQLEPAGHAAHEFDGHA